MVQSKVHNRGAVEFHEHLANLRREDAAPRYVVSALR